MPNLFNYIIFNLFQLFWISKSYLEFLQIIIYSTYESIQKMLYRNSQNASWTRRNWYQCSRCLIFLANVYFNYLKFLNDIWKLFKLFDTALISASYNGHPEIVKLLLEQEGIEINAHNV